MKVDNGKRKHSCSYAFYKGTHSTDSPLHTFPHCYQTGGSSAIKQIEVPIYGSDRVGMIKSNGNATDRDAITSEGYVFTRDLNKKVYELKDHLGNVRVVLGDVKKRTGTDAFATDVKSYSNYYPFGMQMQENATLPPVDTWQSSTYRYGYNGKEKDNELHGEGNSYDYGARLYDPRVGRWLSLDFFSDKYPGISPYNYTANNPILYIDQGGKDFMVYINHTTKTIIIQANIYTLKGRDESSANIAAKKWNSESGNWSYVIGEGEDAVKYDVIFDVQVKAYEDHDSRDQAYLNDENELGNRLVTEDKPWFSLTGDKYGETTKEGLTGGANYMRVAHTFSSVLRKTSAHENGHIFGLGHWSMGLQADGLSRTGDGSCEDNQITKGMVSRVLYNIGIGVLVQTPSDMQVTRTDLEAESKIQNIGNAPNSFDEGKIEERKR